LRKAFPVFFILISSCLTLLISFLFPPSGEAVRDGQSLAQLLRPESGVELVAQAEPVPPDQASPEEVAPPEVAPQAPAEVAPQAPGTEAQPQPAQAPPVAPGPKKVAAPRQQPQVGGGPVSFFFDDADIYEVVQTVFGDVLKVNYIIDPKVKGKVTFRTVTPIPKEEVLSVMEIILRINGVGYVEEKSLYRIIPLPDVPTELVYSQVGKNPDKVAIELFTFKNMNLKDSLTDVQSVIGLNVKGVTMRIIPVQRLNALLVVTSSKEQMDYVRNWIVAFDDMFANARPKITVYPLQNTKAGHVSQMLQGLLGAGGGAVGGTTTTAQKSPTMGTTTTPGTPGAPTAQATTAPKPGPSPSVISTGGGGGTGTGFLVSPETKIFADESTNSLVILSIPGDYPFIEETIKKIDVAPRQVVLEGLIAQVTLNDELRLGFAWALKTNLNITGLRPFTQPLNLVGNATSNPTQFVTSSGIVESPPSDFTFVATDPSGNIRAAISTLAQESKAKIIAAPHILVSDNKEAKIQVGSEVPLATSTTSTPETTTTTTGLVSTSTIQYKDIGIILKVKPQINDSGLVTLEISQEISSVGENIQIAGQGYASINKVEAVTDLVARDGETIIIGGLIREDTTKSSEGIPLLKDIPILGHLFSYTDNTSQRTELIILLTPHVTKSLREAAEVTSEYVNKYKGVTKDKDIDNFMKEKIQKGQTEKNGNGTGSGTGK